MLLYTYQNGWNLKKNLIIPSTTKDTEQLELSYIVGRNEKMVHTLWKTAWQFL